MNRKDLEGIEEKVLEQFKSGKSLFGKDGAFCIRLVCWFFDF